MVKARKIISIMMMVMMILTVVTNVALAGNTKKAVSVDPGDLTIDTKGVEKVQNIGEQIAGIVQVVGSIASVVMLIVLGVKYMMGSAEEKAEYKKTFMPYILGAVLVFAASNLASMIYSWAQQVTAD